MSDQQGLGRRPDGAPEMLAPGEPGFTAEQPALPAAVGEPRPWDPEPPRTRGPLVVLAVFALILMAGVAAVGSYLLTDAPHDHAGDASTQLEAVPPPPFEQRVHAGELYDGDWDFRLGETTASATHTGDWDHPDCRRAALFSADNDRLVSLGCTYRVEGAYRSSDGHAVVSEQVLVFASQSAAETAAAEFDWSAFAFQPDGLTGDAVLTGGSIDVVKTYVIVTMITIDTTDEAVTESAEKLLHWFHTDHVGVFHWK
ncbi:hypothetical protein Afil01_18700 [Actinorhabdospora filicis]|uniref:Uncharacterized protein n=1 Tax=Actinorhabdospora filicis TaxID=1785913 RepID=A0A9W6W8K3_9ACTN|nr:hypothetical protein [Actinorhabdospora filicis]GLZ77063.1 hypothetical protein Afil01_18700 [Actinorhabdospora filicis]